MENNEIIKSGFKRKNIFLIISLISLVLFIALFIWIGTIVNQETGEPEYLHDVIIKSGEKDNIYSKVEIQLLTDNFATYGEGNSTDEKYYFAFDENYGYILNLTPSTFNSLKEINDYTYTQDADAILPEPKAVTGMTKRIPDELKEIAIETYNELMGEEIVNEGNFEEYLGSVYLCEGITPQDDIDLQMLGIFIAGTVFVMFFIYYIVINQKTKRVIKRYKEDGEYEKVEDELEREINKFKKAKVVLTQNYLLDISKGVDIIKYSEIAWIYPFSLRQYGAITSKSIVIVTEDRKQHKIATIGAFSKKQLEEYDSLFNLIVEKSPQALVGYSKENKKAVKNKKI